MPNQYSIVCAFLKKYQSFIETGFSVEILATPETARALAGEKLPGSWDVEISNHPRRHDGMLQHRVELWGGKLDELDPVRLKRLVDKYWDGRFPDIQFTFNGNLVKLVHLLQRAPALRLVTIVHHRKYVLRFCPGRVV